MTAAALLAEPPPVAESRYRIPGNKGIWAGITCEFVEFAVLFAVYFIARAHFPDAFHAGAQRLSVLAGTTITLLMITSSYFIACSVNAIRQDKHRSAVIWLVAGLVVALGYPVTKVLEITDLAHGINGESGISSLSLLPDLYPSCVRHLGHPRILCARPTELPWLFVRRPADSKRSPVLARHGHHLAGHFPLFPFSLNDGLQNAIFPG
jgi:hypothetical protein